MNLLLKSLKRTVNSACEEVNELTMVIVFTRTICIVTVFFLHICLFAEKPKTEIEKVIVIGAGLAGLTTAYRLQAQGIDVEVYEARSRLGGRILTV